MGVECGMCGWVVFLTVSYLPTDLLKQVSPLFRGLESNGLHCSLWMDEAVHVHTLRTHPPTHPHHTLSTHITHPPTHTLSTHLEH